MLLNPSGQTISPTGGAGSDKSIPSSLGGGVKKGGKSQHFNIQANLSSTNRDTSSDLLNHAGIPGTELNIIPGQDRINSAGEEGQEGSESKTQSGEEDEDGLLLVEEQAKLRFGRDKRLQVSPSVSVCLSVCVLIITYTI